MAGRGAAAAIVGLIAGLLVSFVVSAWLRSAAPEAGLLWRAVPAGKLASWTMTGAHGVPLRIQAGAEVSEELGELGERIGDLFGVETERQAPAPRGDFEVRLASLTVLGVLGAVIGALMARSGTTGLADAATGALAAAAASGMGLSVLAGLGSTRLGFDARIVRVGVEAGASVPFSLVAGAVWGGLFAFIGALSAPRVAEAVAPPWRATGAAMRRGALVAGAGSVIVLIVMAIEQSSRGGTAGLNTDLAAIGVVVLGVNVVAAAAVLSHGATMSVALDAGPLSGFTRIGYLPEGEGTLPVSRWLFVVVPIAAGVAAGRVLKRHLGDRSDVNAAAMFGVVWGLVLAALAFLVRVRVLSSFSIGSLAAGGAASINPFVAFVFGAVVAGVSSYIGMATIRGGPEHGMTPALEAIAATSAQDAATQSCHGCGATVPPTDRFCGSCGRSL